MSFFRATDTGTLLLGPGARYTLLATTAETDGDYFALEAVVPADAGPMTHIHPNQIETFYVVEGRLEVMLGDQVYEAKAGDFVHVTKGTPHRFLNRSADPAKFIATLVPAGDIEGYFRQAYEEASDRQAAAAPLDEAMIQRLKAAAARHDIEILPEPEG